MTVAVPALRKRKVIRREVVNRLLGKTLAEARVFPSQSTPAWEEDLPQILVYTRSENATEYAIAPRELRRVIELAIECIASGPETDETERTENFLEDKLDDMAFQVECELSRDDTLGNEVDDIILASTEFEFVGDGAVPIGSARLIYNVTYHTMVPESVDKQAGISDFKRTDADWHVGHDDDEPDLTDVEAKDEVDLPQ